MVQNIGRQINFISGIQGVGSGQQANVNLPVNMRVHSNVFTCQAVNYTGGAGLATTKLTGGGNNALTVTFTAPLGNPSALTIVAGGAGYAVNDTFTIADATGTGTGTVTAVAAGVVTAATLAPTASPINPGVMISACKQVVNGVVIRDITPAQIIQICQSNGYNPGLGELPMFYTEPWRNMLVNSEATSWDLQGQSTFQIQFTIAGTAASPNLTGIQEFDYFRNTMRVGGKLVPSLQPIAQHSFTWNVAAGRNTYNILPINYPIGRIWMVGSTPNTQAVQNLTQLEVYQDKNKIFESTTLQMEQSYSRYGFQFGRANFFNQNFSGTGTLNKQLQVDYCAPSYFDTAFISDPDQRFWKALKCQSELLLVLQSSLAQTVTIVMETLPGAYRA